MFVKTKVKLVRNVGAKERELRRADRKNSQRLLGHRVSVPQSQNTVLSTIYLVYMRKT